jgi:hypothetical protein
MKIIMTSEQLAELARYGPAASGVPYDGGMLTVEAEKPGQISPLLVERVRNGYVRVDQIHPDGTLTIEVMG